MLRRRYTLAYVLLAAAFAVVEGLALLDPGSGDTLSEHVRYMISLSPSVVGPLVVAVLVWLGAHWLWKP